MQYKQDHARLIFFYSDPHSLAKTLSQRIEAIKGGGHIFGWDLVIFTMSKDSTVSVSVRCPLNKTMSFASVDDIKVALANGGRILDVRGEAEALMKGDGIVTSIKSFEFMASDNGAAFLATLTSDAAFAHDKTTPIICH